MTPSLPYPETVGEAIGKQFQATAVMDGQHGSLSSMDRSAGGRPCKRSQVA